VELAHRWAHVVTRVRMCDRRWLMTGHFDPTPANVLVSGPSPAPLPVRYPTHVQAVSCREGADICTPLLQDATYTRSSVYLVLRTRRYPAKCVYSNTGCARAPASFCDFRSLSVCESIVQPSVKHLLSARAAAGAVVVME
jgi:hypothetical protein